jgi:phosphatidate cytidylyltransferase
MTAVILAPLFLALIFLAPLQVFGLFFMAIMLVGSWEFRRLAGLSHSIFGWLMMAVQAVLLYLLFRHGEAVLQHLTALLTAACLVWLLMFVRLVVYRPGTPVDFQYRIVTFASSLAALTSCWIALYALRAGTAGPWWVLLLLLIIWSADTGAYFAGRAFGQRKLAPSISPSKTMAGLYGGMVCALLLTCSAAWFIPGIEATISKLAPLVLVTALASVGGDLFISLHKRTTGIKDSGGIFPGHGGVLDRFDSLLVGAPFFMLGKILLNL